MIKFRQNIEIRCSHPKCQKTIGAQAYFSMAEMGNAEIKRIHLPKSSGWRMGRFVPGVLHPSRGGVAKPGVKYANPGLFIMCPEHVKESDAQDPDGLAAAEG